MAEHQNEEISIIVNQMAHWVLLVWDLLNEITKILISQKNDLEEILLPYYPWRDKCIALRQLIK